MVFEVAIGSECLVTVVTLEWSLVGVSPYMGFQTRPIEVTFVTILA